MAVVLMASASHAIDPVGGMATGSSHWEQALACRCDKAAYVADELTMIADLTFTARFTHPMLPGRTTQHEVPA